MFSTGGYPLGAQDDKNAPYNQPSDVDVNVCISVTYHQNTTVHVPFNYADDDLRQAVRDQISLPGDYSQIWHEDEFEVIKDE